MRDRLWVGVGVGIVSAVVIACTSTLNACPSGEAACHGACVNTSTDSANCGGCGVACTSGFACVQGMCNQQGQQTDSGSCSGATPVACGAVCVNTSTDAMHCGSCSTVCPTTYFCHNGVCTPPATCSGGLMDCFGVCTNVYADPKNCGGCGLACQPGDYCNSGSCTAGSCLPDGYGCNADGQCCSLLCAGDGLCGCIPSGYSGCSADSDCCSNSCDFMSTVCN